MGTDEVIYDIDLDSQDILIKIFYYSYFYSQIIAS